MQTQKLVQDPAGAEFPLPPQVEVADSSDSVTFLPGEFFGRRECPQSPASPSSR
jgi:hypothetical protein